MRTCYLWCSDCLYVGLCVNHFYSVAVWCPHAEMTTDQDLPLDGQSATALFAAKGVDLTTNKDQGVIKVFVIITLSFNIVIVAVEWDSLFYNMSWLDFCLFCPHLTAFVSSILSVKRCLSRSVSLSLLCAGREASGSWWRPANDWGQSYCPLHWEVAQREKVWLQSRSQRTFLLQRGQR